MLSSLSAVENIHIFMPYNQDSTKKKRSVSSSFYRQISEPSKEILRKNLKFHNEHVSLVCYETMILYVFPLATTSYDGNTSFNCESVNDPSVTIHSPEYNITVLVSESITLFKPCADSRVMLSPSGIADFTIETSFVTTV